MKRLPFGVLIATLLLQATFMAVAHAETQPILEQHIFIHYAKDAKAKLPTSTIGYYKLLGAKWKTLPIKLEVNTINNYGLTEDFILSAVGMAAREWDNGQYSGWGGVLVTLFSTIASDTDDKFETLAWSSRQLDRENTILWGNYMQQGVIAVTIIWSNRVTKEIVEFDMVLDTDFNWGDAEKDSGVMDLQNIVTHELGHGLGLSDVYQSTAWQETMYGYATYGETIKRSLYYGDITGIKKLYGA
ncbi:MAG: matrixin family metalloprotease [Candidatus Bathyarchaeota archaeon]|nr:matrixin family metalloprotease [Candidatus Bathyarchaeota archaeon]